MDALAHEQRAARPTGVAALLWPLVGAAADRRARAPRLGVPVGLGTPDSDEAVVGLMALHFLGEWTTFFWGTASTDLAEAWPVFVTGPAAAPRRAGGLPALAALVSPSSRTFGEPPASRLPHRIWPPFLVQRLTHQYASTRSDCCQRAPPAPQAPPPSGRPAREPPSWAGGRAGALAQRQVLPVAVGIVAWTLYGDALAPHAWLASSRRAPGHCRRSSNALTGLALARRWHAPSPRRTLLRLAAPRESSAGGRGTLLAAILLALPAPDRRGVRPGATRRPTCRRPGSSRAPVRLASGVVPLQPGAALPAGAEPSRRAPPRLVGRPLERRRDPRLSPRSRW